MDQLVTLLNGYLTPFTTEKQGKKITSTMINNYVKHGIVHAPVRKRYTKEHVAYLIVVCILKSVYSLEEISTLIQVQIEKCPQELAYNYSVQNWKLFCPLFTSVKKYSIFQVKMYLHQRSC